VVFFSGRQKLFQLWFHTAYDPQRHDWPSAAVCRDPSRTVWSSARSFHGHDFYSTRFPRQLLDGPHKKKGGEEGERSVEELRMYFEGVGAKEAEAAQLDLDRRQVHLMREKRRHTSLGKDYDDLENESEREEILNTLCRGYLIRSSRGWMRRPQKRLCELFTSGRLYISGGNGPLMDTFNTLVVDLAEGDENVLQETSDPDEAPRAWRVRNPHTRCWELLEAEDLAEAARWEQGIADAVRLGGAAKDPLTVFCGFFWKLNSDVESVLVPGTFEYEHWRIRLFVLKADGRMQVYSHKTRSEVVFCDFSKPEHVLECLTQRWPGMENMVLFKVAVDATGQGSRTLAALQEDFEAFRLRVARLGRENGLRAAVGAASSLSG